MVIDKRTADGALDDRGPLARLAGTVEQPSSTFSYGTAVTIAAFESR